MFNTVSFFGFVGVFRDRLTGAVDEYDGPVAFTPEQALQTPDLPPINLFDFWWKLIRYMPWSSAGPFDYSMKPEVWGGFVKED